MHPGSSSKFSFSSHLPALDGIRGLAILMVFVFHYTDGMTMSSVAGKAFFALIGLGWSGVDLFFVLSGFLITGILYETQNNPQYYFTFYVRRVLRIFPVYYLFWLVVLLLTPLEQAHWQWRHLWFLVYLGYPGVLVQPMATSFAFLQFGHLWSLCIEEQFYSIWPMIVRKFSKPTSILKVCGVMFISAFALRILLRHLLPSSHGAARVLLPCRMDSLASGAALAILVRTEWKDRVLSISPKLFVTFATLTAALYWGVTFLVHRDPPSNTIGLSLLSLTYVSLIGSSLHPGILCSVFSWSPLRFVGKYSYGLYLFHFPLQKAFNLVQPWFLRVLHSQPLGNLAYLVFTFSVCLLIAWLSFTYFEAPILRLKSKFEYDKQTQSMIASASVS
jgi:peptidoglycan/LPS O-acetylase OafA/YrhL